MESSSKKRKIIFKNRESKYARILIEERSYRSYLTDQLMQSFDQWENHDLHEEIAREEREEEKKDKKCASRYTIGLTSKAI